MFVETWTNNLSNIDISHYKNFPLHRPRRKTQAKRDSGGLILYIRNDFLPGFELLNQDPHDCIWFRINKSYFNLPKDIIACLCYAVPQGSSFQGEIEYDTFDKIIDRILEYSTNDIDCDFLLAGDLNGRVADIPDYIVDDNIKHLPVPENLYDTNTSLLSDRYNEDAVVNDHGRKILELCKMCNLRIMNGRVGDRTKTGAKTFIGSQGSSTIDLVISSPALFSKLETFNILPITEFSDHRPIEFSIRTSFNDTSRKNCIKTRKMCWSDSKKLEYIDNLNLESCTTKLDEMRSIIEEQIFSENQVNKALQSFVDAVHVAADPLFLKTKLYNADFDFTPKQDHPPWANDEWLEAKSNFRRDSDKYNKNQSIENKDLMIESRKKFKKMSWQCRHNYDKQQTDKLYKARLKNAKEYWKMIRSTKHDTQCNVTQEEFVEYFSKIYNPEDEFYTADPEISNSVKDLMDEEVIEMFDILNDIISEEEVSNAIKELKRNKASGSDLLINELFMYAKNELTEYLTMLFNFVFEAGIFPSEWSEGLLIPLHKKGNLNVPSNFRGITLLSILGKIFTRVLNNRLTTWAEDYGIYVEAQNGFRKGRGTVDNLFILQQLIDNYIEKGEKLYAFFIDFTKAFDYVVRDNLWLKLLKCGVKGKMLNIIISMYQCVKTFVFVNGEKSTPIISRLGVRQGECLSPFLFAIYVNDLESNLENVDTGITVLYIKIFLLFYADDAVLFATSADQLQTGINAFYEYCVTWKLKVNTVKSKIIVFKKGRRSSRENWTYENVNIEVCNQIHYLGIIISSNGSFYSAQNKLSEQATKAIFSMQKNLNKFVNLNPSFQLDLFDKLISPILHYASEVWGFHPAPSIERVHLRFCKRILGVKISTQNDFIYGELGRMPLYKMRLINIVKYWLKIVHGLKCQYVNVCYQLGLQNLNERNTTGWTKSVRDLLVSYGFGDAWYNQSVGDIDIFIKLFKLRLKDIYMQEWHMRLENSTRASFYQVYKASFEYSNYLDCIYVKGHRIALTRLLTSSHALHVESGRWRRNPVLARERRFCFNCPGKVEDEYHFIFECPIYSLLRRQLVPQYYCERPSMFKFIHFLNEGKKKEIIGLAKFVYKANILRSQTIADLTPNA